MKNPPCAVCHVQESAVLIEVAGAPHLCRDYVAVCDECSEKVGDVVPPELLGGTVPSIEF